MIKGELSLLPDEVIYYYVDAISLEWDYEEGENVRKGVGELFVTTLTEENTAELAYKEIAMHGVSSDPANFGAPCVLIQPEDKDYKWLLKPEDSGLSKTHTVQEIYEALSECTELQPAGPPEPGDDEEPTNELIAEMEMKWGDEEEDDQQFEDAEEEKPSEKPA